MARLSPRCRPCSTSAMVFRRLGLPDSVPSACTASMSGSPARTNALSWRDRCMTSSRLTPERPMLALALRFSLTWTPRRLRWYSACSAASRVAARWVPLARCPSGPIATYSNFATSAPHIDRPDDLGHRGHAGLDQPRRLLAERAHPLRAGHLAHLLVRGPIHHQLPDRIGDEHELVHPDAAQIAGLGAEVAAVPAQKAGRGRPAVDRGQKGELVPGRLVRRAAV